MKINVNDCLKLDAFRGSRVLACRDECSRRVRSVSVLDEYDLDMGVERNGVKDPYRMVVERPVHTQHGDEAAVFVAGVEHTVIVGDRVGTGMEKCAPENRSG